MGMAEFESTWMIAQIVGKAETEEGRRELSQLRGFHIAIEREAQEGTTYQAPFDPESATPEELDRWLRSMQ